MPAPEEVKHSRFEVGEEGILYDGHGFAVAWGTWNGETECLGMRWNGDDSDPGYPKLFGHPVWFMIPKALTVAFLKALLQEDHARDSRIVKVLAAMVS